ncbi:hypothetical protein EC968_007553 [Mortierella alpina]|nr:hypothetical protein EC968_007553 [Mortierella alpina]
MSPMPSSLDRVFSIPELAESVAHHYKAVQQVHIEYWGTTIEVIEELLLNLPNLQKLTIVFKAVVDATAVFSSLSARSEAIAEQLDDAEARRSCGYTLQSLSISHLSDFGHNIVDLNTLVRALQACPQLRTLEMNEMSLSSYQDNASAFGFGGVERYALPSMKTLKLTRCTLSEPQLNILDQLFPNLSDLEMSGCAGTWHLAIRGIDRSTPSTANTEALAEEIATRRIVFPKLQRLVLWLEQMPLGECLWRLVERRPHLSVLETDILSSDRDELFRFARYCSGEEMEVAQNSPHIADSAAALNMDVQSSDDHEMVETALDTQTKGTIPGALDFSANSRPRNRFKRLAVQTYVYPPLTVQEFEQFYGALAFRELEYIFLQTRELSMAMFPYANTLTSLHLGGGKEDIPASEFTKLKQLLWRLPRLEVLKVDRYFDSFEIFEGLGREPASLSQGVDGGDGASSCSLGHVDWYGEAPFLTVLDISLRLPLTASYSPAVIRTWMIGTGNRRVSTFLNVEELQTQVLNRFRFLEEVTVRLLGRSRPASKTLEDWSAKRRLSEGASQRCNVSFVFDP